MVYFLTAGHRRISTYMLISALLSSSTLIGQASLGKYPIHNFSPSDYQAGIQNIDFAQNRDRQLFVANNLGVLCYDGSHWQVYAYKTGKKMRSLAFDESHNRLYAGSQGDFGYFEEDWDYVSLVDLIPTGFGDFDEVWDVFVLRSGVYFCTFQYIYAYNGTAISVITQEGGFDRSFAVQGKLFTQQRDGKILEVKGKDLASTLVQQYEGQVVAGMVPYQDGYALFYNSGQIDYATALGAEEIFGPLVRRLQGTFVNHVLALSDTRLAVSTQTAGLFLYDRQSQAIEQVTSAHGLPSNACLRAYQDFAGTLWLGLQSGISLLHINSPMRLVNQDIRLQGSGYDAFQTSDGIYFSTSNGIYYYAQRTGQTTFLSGTEGPAYGLQQIGGTLYAGHHNGLFRLAGEMATLIASTDGLWQLKHLRAKPKYAIAGTYSGLHLFTLDAQMGLRSEGKIAGFDESSRFFEEDDQGDILVSQYYKGLYQLALSDDLRAVHAGQISGPDTLPIHEQIIITRIDQALYLATKEGLYQIDPSTHQITPAPLFSEIIGRQPVYLLQQDQQKNIHVISEDLVGYFRQISASNYAFVPSSLYQLRYNLNNDLLNASVHVQGGIMYSANEGFLYYDPAMEDRIAKDAPLIISRVRDVTQDVDLHRQHPFDQRPDALKPITVNQRAKILQFNLESCQFQNRSNQQFRYFLEGFDETFGDWTSSTTKEYTNLTEGDYRFVAQTRNHVGELTSSLPFPFTVKPPLHRSTLANVFYLVGASLLLVLFYRLQRRRYRRRQQKLEAEIQGELAENQKKLIEIEAQKQRELLQLEEEKLASELRHLNNLLAASTMNLVVKNEFIETIKQEVKEVRRRDKNEETKRALERIEREIDTTLRLQEDWEQFEYHFDQVHGDFLSRLRNQFEELTPNDQKLCAFLRLNLNTKEIANLMSISLRGVEIARYRLRKKLALHKGQNLSKFILEY